MGKIKSKNNQNINNPLLAIVAILIAMSAIQIFQFQKLTNAIENGAIKTNTKTSPQPAGGAVNLPSQVGGCGS